MLSPCALKYSSRNVNDTTDTHINMADNVHLFISSLELHTQHETFIIKLFAALPLSLHQLALILPINHTNLCAVISPFSFLVTAVHVTNKQKTRIRKSTLNVELFVWFSLADTSRHMGSQGRQCDKINYPSAIRTA